MAEVQSISTKHKFVADGIFYAELNEMLKRQLGEDGYAGVEVRATPRRTEIVIKATRTANVLGERYTKVMELSALIQRRHNFPAANLALYAKRVPNRGLCAIAQAESIIFKLAGGLAVRRACYGVLRFIMDSGAKGCEIIVTGKLRAARAKAMKFKDGYMIKTGDAVNHYLDTATRHLNMKQGVLGVKVRIMLPRDPNGEEGPTMHLPDEVIIPDPKVEYPVLDVFAENVQKVGDGDAQSPNHGASPARPEPRSHWGEAAPVPRVQQPHQDDGGWGADDRSWGAEAEEGWNN